MLQSGRDRTMNSGRHIVLQHGKDRIPPRVGDRMPPGVGYRMLHAVVVTECCRATETSKLMTNANNVA